MFVAATRAASAAAETEAAFAIPFAFNEQKSYKIQEKGRKKKE